MILTLQVSSEVCQKCFKIKSIGKDFEKWEFSFIVTGRSENWYKPMEGNLVLLNVLMFVSFGPVVTLYKFILQKYLLMYIMIHIQGYAFSIFKTLF